MQISRMKLSNKGRYAVRALFDIAFFNEGRPTQVKDIAERQNIPPRFLEQASQGEFPSPFAAARWLDVALHLTWVVHT